MPNGGQRRAAGRLEAFDAGDLPASDPATAVEGVDLLGEIIAAGDEIPADVMLVSEVAKFGGVSEDAVRTRALMMAGVARLHKMADGRWVVSKGWAKARLRLKGAL